MCLTFEPCVYKGNLLLKGDSYMKYLQPVFAQFDMSLCHAADMTTVDTTCQLDHILLIQCLGSNPYNKSYCYSKTSI